MMAQNTHDDTFDRAMGALLGLAIGDALGAPVEFQRRDTFEPVTDMRSGGYFKLPAGAWTDDTAMALCLAESLIADPHLDQKDLLDRFCLWASKGENTSTGVCVGIGQNTLRVLGNFYRTGTLTAPETRHKSDGNGAAMRLAPVAIRHWHDPVEACRIADLQSRTTHYFDQLAAGCEYLLAYNLATFLRCTQLPEEMAQWSLTSLQLKLIEIGAHITRYSRAITFQLAVLAVTGPMVRAILAAITDCE